MTAAVRMANASGLRCYTAAGRKFCKRRELFARRSESSIAHRLQLMAVDRDRLCLGVIVCCRDNALLEKLSLTSVTPTTYNTNASKGFRAYR